MQVALTACLIKCSYLKSDLIRLLRSGTVLWNETNITLILEESSDIFLVGDTIILDGRNTLYLVTI